MKKLLVILLTAALLIGTASFALASGDTGTEVAGFALQGLVQEVNEESILLASEQMGEVLVNIDEQTLLEGIEGEFVAGQYVIVEYDGKMTRSLPPQVYAKSIKMHAIQGIVKEVMDGSILLQQTNGENVIVLLGEDAQPVYVGCIVTVYTNGIMALSYPAQVTALHIHSEAVSGIVSECSDDVFLLTDEAGNAYRVLVGDITVVDAEIIDGAALTVYYSGVATFSMPPQINALGIAQNVVE